MLIHQLVVPEQRLPVLILADRVAGIEPPHVAARAMGMLVHACQPGLGDDHFVLVPEAAAERLEAGSEQPCTRCSVAARHQRGPAVLVEAQVGVGLQREGKVVQVVRGLREIAGREVEGHGFQPFGAQAFEERDLEAIQRRVTRLRLRVGLAIGEGSRPAHRFVQRHPGIHQQAAVPAALLRVAEVVLQDGFGQPAAVLLGIARRQPCVLLRQVNEPAADDEGVGRQTRPHFL